MQKVLSIVAIILGLLFLFLAGIYIVHAANTLPSFIPGYDPHLTRHHYTHAAAAAGLGFVCFAFAWFTSGKKKSPHEEK